MFYGCFHLRVQTPSMELSLLTNRKGEQKRRKMEYANGGKE
jgi:hypothetical protein